MSSPSTSSFFLHRHDRVVLAGIAAIFVGALLYGAVYDSFAIALIIGLMFLGAAVGVGAFSKGETLSKVGLPVLGMAMTGLMIHVAHGRSEAHFAVFAFLACLVVYRSPIPVIAGAAAIAVHHLTFNQFQTWGWGRSVSPSPASCGWSSMRSM